MFKKATKHESKLRLALAGPSGSGKTYSALKIGCALGQRVALIDTERGSASKYADLYNFDVLELESFHPEQYIQAIKSAEREGYDLLIIDSLTHAWSGKDGALELVDRAAKRSQSQNSYVAWREVTPLHNALVDAMVQCKCHLIVTMRSKVEYAMEDKNGKKVPTRIGMAPIQREGLEYEFDVFAEMDHDNNFIVQKSRCSTLAGAIISKPDEKVAETLKAWLTGEPAPELTKAQPVIDRPLVMASKPQAPVANGHGNGQLITEGQQRRLFPLLKEASISVEDFKAFLLEQYKLEHTKDITRSQYDQICNDITEGGLAAWVAMQMPDEAMAAAEQGSEG